MKIAEITVNNSTFALGCVYTDSGNTLDKITVVKNLDGKYDVTGFDGKGIKQFEIHTSDIIIIYDGRK